MPPERFEQLAVGDVPEPSLAEQAGLAGGSDELAAIGAERHVVHVAADVGERADKLAAVGREQFDSAILGHGNPMPVGRAGDRVDRIADRRRRGDLGDDDPRRINGRPLRPLRSGLDPALDDRDLVGCRLLVILRRHRQVAVAGQHPHQPALLRMPRHDLRPALAAIQQRGVALQNQLPLAIRRVMAARAVFDEQRRDLAIEIRRVGSQLRVYRQTSSSRMRRRPLLPRSAWERTACTAPPCDHLTSIPATLFLD